jgi:hypothetical protein
MDIIERTIDLNPYAVRDETRDALIDEIKAQYDAMHDDGLPDVRLVGTVVIDSNEDGLDSHATVFTDVKADEQPDARLRQEGDDDE